MLKNAPLAAVLPMTDSARSREFYSQKLGLAEIMAEDGMLMYSAGEDTMLMLYKRPPVTVEHTQVGFKVSDLKAEMAELRAKGVVFEDYDMPGLKTIDAVATIDGGMSCWFKDPDGNILSLNQM